MWEDDFKNLLQTADSAVPTPRIPEDLNLLIQQRMRKKQRTRITLGVAVIAILVISLVAQPWRKGLSTNVEKQSRMAQTLPVALDYDIQAELDNLQQKIDACNARIEQLLAQQQVEGNRSVQLAALPVFDAAWEVREQVEYAAFIGYFQAKRKYERLGLKDSAAADLQDVIRIFPDTRAARQARDLLITLNVMESGASRFIETKAKSIVS